jgi:hypothetical protein
MIILFLDKKLWEIFFAICTSCTAFGGKTGMVRHFSAAVPPDWIFV